MFTEIATLFQNKELDPVLLREVGQWEVIKIITFRITFNLSSTLYEEICASMKCIYALVAVKEFRIFIVI